MTWEADPVWTHEQECSAAHLCARCEEEDARDDQDEDDREAEDCWDCGGDGYVLGDCGEDCCPCADPETQHPLEVCRTCRGKG